MKTIKRHPRWPSWAKFRAVCNPVNSCGEGLYSHRPEISYGHWAIPKHWGLVAGAERLLEDEDGEEPREITHRKSVRLRPRRWYDRFIWRASLRRIV